MDINKLDLNLLKVFDALMKERSVSRAAERLNLSQPALSYALKRLRSQLGDQIVVRGPQGMEPTPFAENLVEPITQILHLVQDQVLREEKFNPKTTSTVFTIGMDTHHIASIAPAITLQIMKEAPNASICIKLLPFDFMHAPQITGDIDVAIGNAGNNPAKLCKEYLFHEKMVGIVRHDHPKYKKKITLEELANNYDHINYDVKGGSVTVFDDFLSKHNLARNCPVSLSDLQGLYEYISSSDLMFIGGIKQIMYTGKRLSFPDPFQFIQVPDSVTEIYSADTEMFWRPQQNDVPAQQWLRSIISEIGNTIENIIDN